MAFFSLAGSSSLAQLKRQARVRALAAFFAWIDGRGRRTPFI